eukprot:10534275-Lingulodinium_polyedra.AAC.1
MASASSNEPQQHHPAVGRIHELSTTSNCLNKQGSQALAVACEAAKQVMRTDLQALVRDHRGRALLSSKSCDGTPMSVVKRVAARLPSGTCVRTRGRAASEFLVKLQFCRALDHQGHQTCV